MLQCRATIAACAAEATSFTSAGSREPRAEAMSSQAEEEQAGLLRVTHWTFPYGTPPSRLPVWLENEVAGSAAASVVV